MSGKPDAPAGWYPDAAVPGQQRFWDGSAWTNQFRTSAPSTGHSLASVTASEHTAAKGAATGMHETQFTGAQKNLKPLMWALIVVAVILAVVGVSFLQLGRDLASIGQGLSSSAADSSETGADDPVVELPSGYEEIAPGIGMKRTNADCEGREKCITADVIALDGCPQQVYIELRVFNEEGAFTNTSGGGGSLESNKRTPIIFGTTLSGTPESYRVTEVRCR